MMSSFLSVFRCRVLLPVLSCFLLLPNLLPLHFITLPDAKNAWESFDPQLAATHQSVSSMALQIDAEAANAGVRASDTAYLTILSDVVQRRFFHGYSHYSLAENWMAVLAGKLYWNHLSAIVLPDDILRYPMASCSQQSIVVMELLRRKGINYRKIGFKHHFALEACMNKSWHFIDTNMEPDFSRNARDSFAGLQNAGVLPSMYQASMSKQNLRYYLSKPAVGGINEAPAPNAALFHLVTKFLSRTLWLLPLLLWVFLWYRDRKQHLDV